MTENSCEHGGMMLSGVAPRNPESSALDNSAHRSWTPGLQRAIVRPMFIEALFGLGSLMVLVACVAMGFFAWRWLEQGKRSLHTLGGAALALRHIARDLHEGHPIRRRLESAPVVELALEELAHLIRGGDAESAARGLVLLEDRSVWIERFAQVAVHLGLLGTVAALVSSDPSDLDAFRSSLPLALGTTFWGLVAALILSWMGGTVESLLSRARRELRDGLLASFDVPRSPSPALEEPTAVKPDEAAP